MQTTLYYFPIRGRGEQIRLLLHALEVPFADERIRRERFHALKQQGPTMLPFGSLPLLERGALRLAQGPAIMSYLAREHGVAPSDSAAMARADMITLGAEDLRVRYFKLFGDDAEAKQAAFEAGDWKQRWLPSLEGLLVQSGTGYFVGDRWTHADIAVWDVVDAVVTYTKPATLDGFPRLQEHRGRISQIPGLAAYVASDERPA